MAGANPRFGMSQSRNTVTGPTAAAMSSSNLDTEVGKVVIDMGLATKTEITFCREQQKQASDPNARSLSDLLIEHNFITVNQAKRIRQTLAERKSNEIPGYEILGQLGKGAMATVYKARQLSLDRIVAIKILPKKMNESRDFVERFYKEGKAAARLSHNNIVQAIDVGESPKGLHYFVMEYLEGKTLYDMMAPPPAGEGHKFTEDEALDISIQMADALAHAHQRGLIHRDVKPKNIMLTPQRRRQVDRSGSGPRRLKTTPPPKAKPEKPTARRTTSAPSKFAATWTSTSAPISIRLARRCITW